MYLNLILNLNLQKIIQAEINDIKDIKYITSEFLGEIFDINIS